MKNLASMNSYKVAQISNSFFEVIAMETIEWFPHNHIIAIFYAFYLIIKF